MFTRKTNKGLAFTLTIISLTAATQAANANQWSDMFKNMLVPPSATTSSSSSDAIAVRETQLANRIVDAISTNKLSPADTQNLKGQLDRLKAMEASYRSSGTLGPVETASINTELTKVEQSFNQMIAGTPTVGVTVPPGGRIGDDNRTDYQRGDGYQRGDYKRADRDYQRGDRDDNSWRRDGGISDGRDFDLRQADVLRRIDERAANGRLTSADAADLRSDYRRLEQLEASYRADGKLTPYEINVLQNGLDSITRELKDKSDPVASQYPEIDAKQAALKRRIDDGVAKRLIKGGDAQRLTDNLNWIASIEAGFRQSGGRLDKAEADRILADLDRLSAKIDRFSINPVQDLVNRKTDLQRKIDDNVASGKLSQRASRDLRRDLDRVSYPLQNASATLPPELINQISSDLDRINSQLNSTLTYSGNRMNNGGGWHDHDHGPRDWGNR
ncbi:MAG TPA: hypothetical protein V6C89_18215 [Drouetiella sp.]|jgi:hypothetical protein